MGKIERNKSWELEEVRMNLGEGVTGGIATGVSRSHFAGAQCLIPGVILNAGWKQAQQQMCLY